MGIWNDAKLARNDDMDGADHSRAEHSSFACPDFPIFVSVQPSSTTLFRVPFPLPTPQGRWDSQLRTMPEREFRMLRKATPRTWRPLWQTYLGRSARVAARPEGQAAPPHVFNLPERLSPRNHGFSLQAVTYARSWGR